MIGADANAQLADGLNFAGGSGAMVLVVAADADGAMARHSPKRAQALPQTVPSGSLTGLFNRGGLIAGLAAGFLGSGVLGLLFGRGLFGGLVGIPSYFGLVFQLVLLAMLGRLIWMKWREGEAAKAAPLSPRQLADPYLRSRDDLHAGLDSSAPDGAEGTNAGQRRSETTSTRDQHG
jgi:predicted lipid-binding transport protein (Tim44 family)